MSFISTLRDYTDIANNLAESFGENFNLLKFISELTVYSFKTLQLVFIYIFTFQWVRDFTLLPILIPETFDEILNVDNHLLWNKPFEFLEIPNLAGNKFILGFFNSFFFSLPFSVVHIIAARRLIIQGVPAAIYSISGYLVGQWLFLCCTIFGIRSIIIPWLSFQTLSYILGFILLFRIVHKMFEDGFRQTTGWSDPQYRDFFVTTFLLAWCEQISIFQYLGNVTLTTNPSILEPFTSANSFENFLSHFQYVMAIGLGTILFTCFWGYVVLFIKFIIFNYFGSLIGKFMQFVHYGSIVILISLSISTIPFYAFDYLLTGPLGFVSNDKAFDHTFLYQYDLPDLIQPSPFRLRKNTVKAALLGKNTLGQSIETEHTPYNAGRYLAYPTDPTVPHFSYEDLNFRGDAAVCHKEDKKGRMAGFLTSFASKKGVDFNQVSDEQNEISQEKQQMTNEIVEIKSYSPSSPIEQRFADWYRLDNFVFEPEKETIETSIQKLGEMTTLYFRKSFPLPLDQKFPQLTEAQQKDREFLQTELKRRFYLNPTYHKLLTGDIDFFLNRQPETYKLDGDQEWDLYNKRLQLFSYWNSIRDYKKLPYTEQFDQFFDGSKSFVHKVYNQQFRGTLRNVRRLFSIALEDSNEDFPVTTPNTLPSVLKFDQPLYTFSKESRNKSRSSIYHEELDNFDEYQNNSEKYQFNQGIIPPFYAGWDETSRQFVLTNKFLPHDESGYSISLAPELSSKFNSDFVSQTREPRESKTISFTTWPLSREALFVRKENSKIPYVSLFYPGKLEPEEEEDGDKPKLTPEEKDQLLEGLEIDNMPSSVFVDHMLKGVPANFETLLREEPEDSPFFEDEADKSEEDSDVDEDTTEQASDEDISETTFDQAIRGETISNDKNNTKISSDVERADETISDKQKNAQTRRLKNRTIVNIPKEFREKEELSYIVDYLAPKRGGFIWAGSQKLATPLQDQIDNIKDWVESTMDSTKNVFTFSKKK